jgi:hypothetical protein
MAIMTAGNAIVCTGGFDLIIFYFPIGKSLFLKSGLEETPAPTAAIIVGTVGLHIDKIFFPHHRFDHKPQVFGNGIP